MLINIKKVFLFVFLTFLYSYLLVIVYLALGGKWIFPGSLIITLLYMFVPMFVTVVIHRLYREPWTKLGISWQLNWWFLVAWLLPPISAIAALGISLLFPDVEYTAEMPKLFEQLKSLVPPAELKQIQNEVAAAPMTFVVVGILQGLIAGLSVNAIAAFGEELGWRGFLQKELNGIGFWKASVFIGLIWGIWHAPIILQGHNYPQHPVIGVFMMTLFTVLLSPIYSYIRIKAKSVVAAAILHGTMNGTAGLSTLVIQGGNDLTVGLTGLAGFITLVVIIIGLVVYDYFKAQEPILHR